MRRLARVSTLKGWRLWKTAQIAAPDAPGASRLAPHNLPQHRTAFVGREKELAEVPALLEEHRLVTLGGVGGSGKTRLAVEVARTMLDRGFEEVRFVDLSTVTEDARVVAAALDDMASTRETGPDIAAPNHARDRAGASARRSDGRSVRSAFAVRIRRLRR